MKTAAIITALLAGTVVAGAHPHGQGQWQQQGRQGPHQFQGHRQGCPVCGNPQFRSPRHGSQQQGPGGRGPQFQHDGPPPRFQQDRQGQREPAPQQWEQMKQRRRQAILEHFDADGDGQLSNEERQAVRAAMKERHDKRDTKSARKGPPPSGE